MPVLGERHRFTRAILAEAPDAPGVYALWDERGVLFYGSAFGGTFTIRSCLAEHLAGVRGFADRATHCSWEISLSPGARERQLLDEYRAQHGGAPRGNAQSG
jgi:hypothetical protein